MSATDYVAAAYVVVFVALLVYLAIMAAKVSRPEREVDELKRPAGERDDSPVEDPERVSVG